MEANLEVIKNNDESGFISFKFSFKVDKLNVVMIFNNSDKYYKQKWKRFIEALKRKDDYKIQYCNNGGEVYIEMKDGFTTFKTSKYNIGGDGDIKITIETDRCKELFYGAYDSFK